MDVSTAAGSHLRSLIALAYTDELTGRYILPGPLASAEAQAERLRQAVASFPFGAPELDLRLTVSIGIAEWHPPDETATDLVARADWLLYQAKDEGRNRAVSGPGLSLYRWVAATAIPQGPAGR
jgi:GGDEF domain-containing protein